jgi:site-specific DNA-cytosine methylase
MSSGQANAAIAQDMAHTLNATHETQTVAMPVVIDRAAFNQGQNAQYEPHIAESEVMDSLVARGPHAVGQPIPFRKSKRACSTTDNETWVEADASKTLNNFDLGDTRTTHAVVACSDVSPTISSGAPFSKTGNERVECEAFIVQASELLMRGKITEKDVCPTLTADAKQGDTEPLAVHAIAFQPGNLMRKAGSDPSTETFPTLTKDSGDQSPHVAHQVYENSRRDAIRIYEGVSPTLQSFMGTGGCNVPMVQPQQGVNLYNQTITGDVHVPLRTAGGHGAPACMTPMAVRRLTPRECERLQGFSDDWSRISWKGKPAEECPDGPRYKACGNSMAVPVMRWIGERIAAADAKHFPHA